MLNHELDSIASQAIYKDFIAGKIINPRELVEGVLVTTEKYRQLVDNLDSYRTLYHLMGFEIRTIGGSGFYLTRSDRSEEMNEVATSIQVLLMMIARGLGLKGVSTDILFDHTAGISIPAVNEIADDTDIARILKACGIQLPLEQSVNGLLLGRGIMFLTDEKRYILTDAGQHFFKALFGIEEAEAEW